MGADGEGVGCDLKYVCSRLIQAEKNLLIELSIKRLVSHLAGELTEF